MKQRICALALGALLTTAAQSLASLYQWDGGGSTSAWTDSSGANWRNNTIPPLTGDHDIYVRAADLVGSQTTANWDYSSSSASYGLFSVVANSTTGMTLQKSGAGSFTATGRLSMTGYSSTRVATLDADASMTVTGITVQSYGAIDVANSVTVTNNTTFTIDALNGYSQCSKTGSGTLQSGNASVLTGSANDRDAVLIISAGTMAADGALAQATSAYTSKANIQLTGGTLDLGEDDLKLAGGNPSSGGQAGLDFISGTLSAAAVDMRGLAKIETQQSFSTGDFSVSVGSGDAFATEATVDVAVDEVISVGTIVIGGTQACKLVVLIGGEVVTGGPALTTDGGTP